MLKYSQHILLPCLVKIFNQILKSRSYPDNWTTGYVSPLFKTGNPFVKDNYRGITITSCLGKLFNSVLNTRIEEFLIENKLIPDVQIAYKANSRTSDHMFILKTLVDKILKKEKQKLYTCFVDFKKAFDTLSHDSLFYKLASLGIGGNIHSLIKDMYSKTQLSVRVKDQMSVPFSCHIGVRQGDNLSPNLFKIYTHDLVNIIDDECEPPVLQSTKVGCLLFADDVILLSTTANGLQKSLIDLQNYCTEWGLTVNTKKTKTLIFNANGRKVHIPLTYNGEHLECVNEYKYLGTLFTTSGSFTKSTEDLYNRGLKAFFKLKRQLSQGNIKSSLYTHLFDTMVKPVLLYTSEIWGPLAITQRKLSTLTNFSIELAYDKLHIEKIQNLLCRTVLGVNAKATKMALYSETGRYPLYIDAIINTVKYLNRLEAGNCSNVLREAFECNKDLATSNIPCWYNNTQRILQILGIPILDGETLSTSKLKYALIQRFDKYWFECAFKQNKPSSQGGKKLRTYGTFKEHIKTEAYLNIILDKESRSALARFRTSTHNLNIETGRYTKQPVAERKCKMCPNQEVEDEIHFLTECPAYDKPRTLLYAQCEHECKNFANMANGAKFIWLMTAESAHILHATATFLKASFKYRNEFLGFK